MAIVVVVLAGLFTTFSPLAALIDCNFSDAVLFDVEFRRLNLDRVTFPKNSRHLVVHHYPCMLQRRRWPCWRRMNHAKLVSLRLASSTACSGSGPDQQVGVFSLLDYKRRGGPELVAQAADLLRRCEAVYTSR